MENERLKTGRRATVIGLACNIALAFSKLGIGVLSGMISIIADSVNNFSDSAASIVSFIGFKLSSKPADDKHPFGHARFEYVSGLVVAFLVMAVGVEILKSSIEKIIHPAEIDYSAAMYIVLSISIAVKIFMMLMYLNTGKKISSTTLKAAAADSRNDILTTAAVLIATVISQFCGLNLDGPMGAVVALFIIISSISLVKDTLDPLLGITPDEELVDDIGKRIMSYEGVIGVHDLMMHDYGPGHCFASVHVEVPANLSLLRCHDIIDKIEGDVGAEFGIELTIHPDPVITEDDGSIGTLRNIIIKVAAAYDPTLKIHEVRVIPGDDDAGRLIFDCLIPAGCTKTEEEVCRDLKWLITEKCPGYTLSIRVDHSLVALNKPGV
ncbi:MAG: cation diffusion facilitator family transporter [Lachnospiraceae bacterium]|nr:cation diffusion facilitator family transporter [Lachnospiraceae bacterium]